MKPERRLCPPKCPSQAGQRDAALDDQGDGANAFAPHPAEQRVFGQFRRVQAGLQHAVVPKSTNLLGAKVQI
jgi:hypothetical protein